MARRKCPCCGQPYNGKRCKNCFYEHFTEEITHGNHAHEGEPLVVRQAAPKASPQVTITRESDCKPYAGRKKEKNPVLKRVVVAVVVLISLVSKFSERVSVDQFTQLIPDFADTVPVESLSPGAMENGFRVYDDGQVLLTADWDQGRKFRNPITVMMRNDADLALSAMAESIYVNGYRMEYASFYCEAEPGEIAQGELWLDEEELANCGIADVQQILLDVILVDEENYDCYGRSGPVLLEYAVSLGFEQPVDDSGLVLYEKDGVRVIFRKIAGTACEDAWLEMFIENNSDRVMDINFESVAVNDTLAEVYLFCRLEPGTRAIATAPLWNLPDVGIDAVAEMKHLDLTLEMIPGDDWDLRESAGPLRIDLT